MKLSAIAVFAASAFVAQATYNVTSLPGTSPVTTIIYPTGGSSSIPAHSSNGTIPTTVPTTGGSAPTKTPVGPSTTTSPGGPAFTGAAVSNQAFSGLAAAGLVLAYFL